MSDGTVVLKIDGQDYGGWKTLRCTRGLEQLAGTFELSVTERWAGQDVRRPILRGASCALVLDGHVAITGFVDEIAAEYDDASHTLTVNGRDATCDLVDCSTDPADSQTYSLTFDAIAKRVCKPFGVGVIVQADVGAPFSLLNYEPGQKCFDFLCQLARFRGLLLTSDGLGHLLITEPGKQVASTMLQLGANAKSGSVKSSLKNVYSRYDVYSQFAGADSAEMTDVNFAAISTAADPTVKRYRPLSIMAEVSLNLKYASQRAVWERNTRQARSTPLTHTVNGFSHKQGLWAPNWLVSVDDRYANLKEQRLISEVTHVFDDKGARTMITTVGKQAYDRIAEPEFDGIMDSGGGDD